MDTKIKIEKLLPEDIGAVAKLYVEGLAREAPPGSADVEAIGLLLGGSEVHTLVAKSAGQPIGLLSYRIQSDGSIHMDFIYAALPRKGVGTMLMDRLKDLAAKSNVQKIYTRVSSIDPAALGFYRANGFIEFGEQVTESGLKLHQMMYRI